MLALVRKTKMVFIMSLCMLLLSQQNILRAQYCNTIDLNSVLSKRSDILYQKCFPTIPFCYNPLPVTSNHYLHPYEGYFNKSFIVTIPHGKFFGTDGWILEGDDVIQNFVWQNCYPSKTMLENSKPSLYMKNRIAVISQTGYTYYYHFLVEVLGRLALLEMHNIEYDFLYVPTKSLFMKELLHVWGIDPSKIIEADDSLMIEADELIVPSLVASAQTNGCPRLAHYIPKHIVDYIRNKLLEKAKQLSTYNANNFGRKIFISRKDTSARRMINEDEVFELFQERGFERFELGNLSILEQILLFYNAEIVVGALGSGLANVIFCNKNCKVIDIFQARRDATIYYLCQSLELDYQCVKTTEFIDANDGQYDTTVPLEIIETLLKAM